MQRHVTNEEPNRWLPARNELLLRHSVGLFLPRLSIWVVLVLSPFVHSIPLMKLKPRLRLPCVHLNSDFLVTRLPTNGMNLPRHYVALHVSGPLLIRCRCMICYIRLFLV